MFPNSTILNPIFWIVMGLIYALVISGFKVWAEDLGLKMNWWKWLLSALWYAFLSIIVAGGATLIAENETSAGLYMWGFFGVFTLVLGVGLWRLLMIGRENKEMEAKK